MTDKYISKTLIGMPQTNININVHFGQKLRKHQTLWTNKTFRLFTQTHKQSYIICIVYSIGF